MGTGTTLTAPGLGSLLGAAGSNWYSIILLSGIVGSLARNMMSTWATNLAMKSDECMDAKHRISCKHD